LLRIIAVAHFTLRPLLTNVASRRSHIYIYRRHRLAYKFFFSPGIYCPGREPNMRLCPSSLSPFDFADPCIRESWASLLPAVLVITLCFFSLPISLPKRVHNFLGLTTFKTFLTLREAEALDASVVDEVETDVVSRPPLWRTLLISTLSVVETLAWLALGLYRLITRPFHPSSLLPFILALAWIYASLRPILRPSSTPPYDLFSLFVVHLVTGMLMLGGVLYSHHVLDAPMPGRLSMIGLVGNLVGVVVGFVVVVNIPMAVPSSRVKKEEIVCLIRILSVCVVWESKLYFCM